MSNKDVSYKALLLGTPQNEKESIKYANVLATGNYPCGLDGCFTVGISGGCGTKCFVYQDGECKEPEEFIEAKYKEMTIEEIKEFKDLYPQCIELCNKLLIMKDKEKENNSLKISIPILTNMDLDDISNYHNELIDKFTQGLAHDKDLLIAQELIKIQKKEIEKKDKMINLMSKRIQEDSKWLYSDFKFNAKSREEIKKYFEELVEDGK
jgi:methyl-accepting chemotaxis protein